LVVKYKLDSGIARFTKLVKIKLANDSKV